MVYGVRRNGLVPLEAFGSLERFVMQVGKLTNLFARKERWPA